MHTLARRTVDPQEFVPRMRRKGKPDEFEELQSEKVGILLENVRPREDEKTKHGKPFKALFANAWLNIWENATTRRAFTKQITRWRTQSFTLEIPPSFTCKLTVITQWMWWCVLLG